MAKREFSRYIAAHKDLRGGGDEAMQGILSEGFREGRNVNAVPMSAFGGGQDIISQKYGRTRAGDKIYLLPEEGVVDGPNGLKTRGGYKPDREDVVDILHDGQTLESAWRSKGILGTAAAITGAGALFAPEDAEAKVITRGGKRMIESWHGTPHRFPAETKVRMPDGTERFITGDIDQLPAVPEGAEVIREYPLGRVDNSKIGTGEGAQVYGYGGYSADRRGTAEYYRNMNADAGKADFTDVIDSQVLDYHAQEGGFENKREAVDFLRNDLVIDLVREENPDLPEYVLQNMADEFVDVIGDEFWEASKAAESFYMQNAATPPGDAREAMDYALNNLQTRYDDAKGALDLTYSRWLTTGDDYFDPTPGATTYGERDSMYPLEARVLDMATDPDSGLNSLRDLAEELNDPVASRYDPELGAIAQQWVDQGVDIGSYTGKQTPSSLYKMEIDADPDTLLHWDRKFDDQAPYVQEQMKAAGLAPDAPGDIQKNLDTAIANARKNIAEMKANVRPSAAKWFKNDVNSLETKLESIANARDTKEALKFFSYLDSDIKDIGHNMQESFLKNDTAFKSAQWNMEGLGEEVRQSVKGPTGQDIYQKLERELGKQGASDKMKELGIPGLQYLDGVSRGKGRGSHNYVMFDDSLIDIKERGAIDPRLAAGIAAGTGGVLGAGMMAGPEIRDTLQGEGLAGALDVGWGALQNAGKFAWDAGTNFGSALMGTENEVPTPEEYNPMTETGRAINQAAGGAFDALLNYQPPLRDQTIGEEAGDLMRGYTDTVRPWLQENLGEYGTRLGEAGAGLLAAVGIPGKTRKAVNEFTPDAGYTIPPTTPRPEINAPDRPIPPEPERIPALFGSKAEREASQAAQIEANAGMLADETVSKAKSAAVPPDYYRELYRTMGLDAVLDEAKANKHLKPTPTGFVGVPRHIRDMEGIEDMRRSLDSQLDNSAEAIAQAEMAAGTPERIGTWYPRAKDFNWQVNEPYQMPRWLEGVGTYSAGVAPEAELGFNLKHWNSRAVGDPKMAYRGAPMRSLDTAVEEYRPANLGFKIGEYGLQKNNPAVTDPSPFGVNDFRMAQTFGYTDPAGNPWKAGVSATMHPVMDAETALLVDRANQGSFAGKTDWTGETVQEIPWIGGKAQDIYSRGSGGRFSGPEGQAMALREANNTAADYAPKHEMAATYEATPGASSGHRQDIREGSLADKEAYQAAAPWTFDDRGMDKDVFYSALGLRQQPTVDAPGVYRNSQGEVERNPVKVARPLVDFQTVEQPSKNKREREKQKREGRLQTGTVAPTTMDTITATEGLRGLLDAQEASAANLPITSASRGGRNDILIDTGGNQVSQDQMGALLELLGDEGISPTATSRGVLAMNFNELSKEELAKRGISGREKTKIAEANTRRQSQVAGEIQKRTDEILGIVPGAKVERAGREATYIENTFGPEQYTGKYTMNALERLANLPENAWRNIAESEDVRTAIRNRIERDQGHPLTRKDLQETRRFFSEEAWQDVVALIKKGMKPAAALAAMGFAANTMAEEEGALAE